MLNRQVLHLNPMDYYENIEHHANGLKNVIMMINKTPLTTTKVANTTKPLTNLKYHQHNQPTAAV